MRWTDIDGRWRLVALSLTKKQSSSIRTEEVMLTSRKQIRTVATVTRCCVERRIFNDDDETGARKPSNAEVELEYDVQVASRLKKIVADA